MGILDAAAKKVGAGLGLALYRELRALRRTLEVGIDTYREVHHLEPRFAKAPARTATVPEPEIYEEPDFLRVDVIEELAREHHIPFDETTDLEALAVAQGWVEYPGGDLKALPESHKHLTL